MPSYISSSALFSLLVTAKNVLTPYHLTRCNEPYWKINNYSKGYPMYYSHRLTLVSTFVFSITLSACGSGGVDSSTPEPEGIKPTANAGTDQEVVELDAVNLSGTLSTSNNSSDLTYLWRLVPPIESTSASLSSSTDEKPSFEPDVGGIYTATLVVNNGEADSIEDSVKITVLDQLTHNEANDGHAYYNASGTQIAFHSDRGDTGDFNIWVMDADGENLIQITNNLASDRRPHWSPDGSQIVFHSNRSGNEDLYIKNADGTGTATRITSNTNGDTHPYWHPTDATQVFYQSSRSGFRQIRTKTVGESGSMSLIAGDFNVGHPMLSHDGSKVAYGRNSIGGRNDIWVANIDGTDLTQLTNTPDIDEQHADWSPDDSQIAMRYVNLDNSSDIWLMDSDGSNKSQLTKSLADDRNPEWHPDGKSILIRSNRTGNNELFRYPLE